MTAFAARRGAFRDLHIAACFVIPGPWDGRSATAMARVGSPAIEPV